jgi:hypothetical protein
VIPILQKLSSEDFGAASVVIGEDGTLFNP